MNVTVYVAFSINGMSMIYNYIFRSIGLYIKYIVKGIIIHDFVNIPLQDGTDPVHRPSWPHFMESGPTKR